MEILLGNIFSGCAMLTDSFSGTRKTHKQIILIQTVSLLFYCASSFVLKGYSALVQNVVAIFRNFFSIKGNCSKVIEWILLALGVILGVYFNNLGTIGLLPIIANLEYTFSVFKFKNNVTALKMAFIINAILFGIFNVYLKNYVGLAGNTVLVVTTVISLLKTKNDAATEEETSQDSEILLTPENDPIPGPDIVTAVSEAVRSEKSSKKATSKEQD